MFCPKCGKQIDDSDAFCRHCGHGISSAPPASGPVTVNNISLPPLESNPTDLSNISLAPLESSPVTVKNVYVGKKMQILGIVIFLFCGVGGCAVLLNSRADSTTGGWCLLGAIIGLVLYIIGRFRHWYHAE